MTRMNWKTPRGRGHGGGSVSRMPSGGELGQMLADINWRKRDYIGKKQTWGLMRLRQKAAAGDKAAQARLAIGLARQQAACEPARKKQKAATAERHANDVPKGLKRVKRYDRETGEVIVADLPIPGRHFAKVMQHAEVHRARPDLAPDLSLAEWRFLLFGDRIKVPHD